MDSRSLVRLLYCLFLRYTCGQPVVSVAALSFTSSSFASFLLKFVLSFPPLKEVCRPLSRM